MARLSRKVGCNSCSLPGVLLVACLLAAPSLAQDLTSTTSAASAVEAGVSAAEREPVTPNSTTLGQQAAALTQPVATQQAAAATQETSTAAQLATTAAAAAAEPVKKGVALEDAVEANSEAQDYKEDARHVRAQVVELEAPVELASGTGDIDTTGACSAEVDTFCIEVKPGEGRLAKCLTQQLAEEEKPKFDGTKVSGPCRKALDAFLFSRSENINADLPLAKACVKDAEKLCKNMAAGTTVLACLRDNKDQLASECKAEVFERQAHAADDWRTDSELFKACEVDAKSQCANVDPHGGKTQECLRDHRALLSWDCQEELFRQEVENADDLRLSARLFKACLGDKKKFCPDVQPGNARAKECLEENRDKPDFSPQCKTEVEKMMADRAADFRLDAKLRKLCAEDIADMCGYERDSLDTVAGYDARVIQCLQDYRDEISNPGCKARVQKIMEYASSDIRFDVPLADACYEDRQDFCSGVPPGSARVIRCLQDRREDLSYECRATLFDQEVSMAENIDFQFPMKKKCGGAIQQFCKDIPHGHARVIRCLQDNLDNAAMPEDCKKEVADHIAHTANDYRLNYRLSSACHATIAEKCAETCTSNSIEQPCGGTVLRCLTEKAEEITDENCQKEVLYFQKMEVRDFRNDVILAESCRADVDQFCADVKPVEGQVHKCLWDNKDKISKACRSEEIKIQIMQSSNTDLMPKLSRSCKAEREAHCKGIRAGKSRVINCLISNSDAIDFTEGCKDELLKQQEKRTKDYRMDYDLRVGCKADIPKVCQGELTEEDRETGAVLRCLVKNVEAVSDTCSHEISRAVRAALQLYQPKLPVLEACDGDISTYCLADRGLHAFKVGEIRRCLMTLVSVPAPPDSRARLLRRLLEEVVAATTTKKAALNASCEALVMLANPGDAYTAFSASWNATAISGHIKNIESKFGLKEGTLTPHDAPGILTLTGWTAAMGVLALVAVVIGGGVWGYRRYHGLDGVKGYIRVVKGKAPSGL